MIRVYVSANLVIFLCFQAMPVMAVVLGRNLRRMPIARIWLILFAGFVATCGQMHALENIGAFYFPRYDLFTIGYVVVACFAVTATALMPQVMIELHDRTTGRSAGPDDAR